MDMGGIVAALGQPGSGLRLRQGSIVSVASDGTATITIAGSATQVSGVKVASSCCPVPGATCWLATDGRDLFVLATLAPAGPAWATMRKSTGQTIATATWVDLTFGSRTDTNGAGLTMGSGGLTVVVPGLYQINLSASLDNAGDTTWPAWAIYAALLVNSGTVAASGGPAPSNATFMSRASASALCALAVGDVIGAQVYQNSGGNLTTSVAAGLNVLSAVWLGPA